MDPETQALYRENSEEDAADEDADAVEGELGRRVAAVGQAMLVLKTGRPRDRRRCRDPALEQRLVQPLVNLLTMRFSRNE